MFSRDEEEVFVKKERKPEKIEKEGVKEERDKINSLMERVETIAQQVNIISKYLSTISQKVSKAVDASVAYQRDLDDLDQRINLLRSKLEEIENVVPEVELEKKTGRRAG
jgi:flagellar biosynthesis chaperone FliJ